MRLFILMLVALCGLSQADNRQAARDAYREGSRLYDLQDYKGALEAFKKAYVNFEDPTLLFNIAQCQRYLGQKQEAVISYRNFLRKAPTSPMADEVRRLITQLDDAIKQDQRANSAPPSGTLSPGGKSAAKSPSKASETRPPEKLAEKNTVSTPSTTNTAERKPEPAAVETPALAVQRTDKRDDQPLIKKWWLWTAVGAGVVVIALGVGLGVGLSSPGDAPYPSTGAKTIFQF